jgi:hypothetical protein
MNTQVKDRATLVFDKLWEWQEGNENIDFHFAIASMVSCAQMGMLFRLQDRKEEVSKYLLTLDEETFSFIMTYDIGNLIRLIKRILRINHIGQCGDKIIYE